MFRLGRPTDDDLQVFVREARELDVTYAEVGASLTDRCPPGYRHDRYERVLDSRSNSFPRAIEGIRTWAAHLGAGLEVTPAEPPTADATVVVSMHVGPLTAVAPCRIVRVIDEDDRYGHAYGTLPGHPEVGEESFVVEKRGQDVVFVITAFSRPAERLARIGGPITRRIQQATTRRYLDGLANYVKE